MKQFDGLDELQRAVGSHLGYSSWHTVPQSQIDQFAAATGDHQWIHVDPLRAADSPFGTTIAHGYLTLSLLPTMLSEIYQISGLSMRINYGSNRVRFPSPVPVNSRLRAGAELIDLARKSDKAQATVRVTIERAGFDKPACVAETVSLLVE